MSKDEAQKKWDEYFDKMKKRRLEEAEEVWKLAQAGGVTDSTMLILDFLLFTKFEENANTLSKQLSENYNVQVFQNETEKDYWDIVGTTRPYGVTISGKEHLEWIEFICDLGRSHNCVLSTWSIEAPELEAQFKNEDISNDED